MFYRRETFCRIHGHLIIESLQESLPTNTEYGLIDASFYRDDLDISGLKVKDKTTNINFDINNKKVIYNGDSMVRAVAMDSTDGLQRGTVAVDTGIRYNIASIIEIFRFKGRKAVLLFDDNKYEDYYTLITICNTIHVGKGMKMAPQA